MLGDAFMQEGLYDSSVYYLNKIIVIAPKVKGSEYFKEGAETNLGLVYKKQKKYDQAITIFNKTLADKQVMADPYNEAAVRNNLGSTYSEMGEIAKAKFNFDSSISICNSNGFEFLLLENYKNIATMYERSGNATLEVDYLKKYHELHDSINSRDNQNQLNQLERNYFEDANEKLLTTQKEKSRRYSLIALFTALLALSISYFYYRSRKKSALLNKQKLEIEKQNLALEKLNQTKDKLFRVIGHDLRNPLVSLSAYLDKTSQTDQTNETSLSLKKETTKALQDSIGLLDNLLTWASSQLHAVAVTKRNIGLDDLIDDVCIALKPQADLKQIKFDVDINQNANSIISNAEMLAIIFRNVLTNSIKFSHPSQTIFVTSELRENKILLKFIDEGIGMSNEELNNILHGTAISQKGTSLENGSGLGLSIIKDLAAKLNIEWTIESQENKGTVFALIFNHQNEK
jgi:signal transduction histidine kinase